MQTLNFSIEIPQTNGIDLGLIKQKVKEYAVQLLSVGSTSHDVAQEVELDRAMQFMDSLVVSGGKSIPVEEDGVESLVAQKF